VGRQFLVPYKSLDRCRLKIISSGRKFVEGEKLISREFEVCLLTDEPLFAELTMDNFQPCTKYIEKTGDAFYVTASLPKTALH
jgi:hypothetical protein